MRGNVVNFSELDPTADLFTLQVRYDYKLVNIKKDKINKNESNINWIKVNKTCKQKINKALKAQEN